LRLERDVLLEKDRDFDASEQVGESFVDG